MSKLASVTAVLDTNVFVAAAFNPDSHSARIIEAVRQGQLQMFWNEQTYQEIQHLLQKIPRLAWEDFSNLFREQDRYQVIAPSGRREETTEQFDFVTDRQDRKFAALAEATGATLVTQDKDLLSVRRLIQVPVLRPREFVEQTLRISTLDG